MYDYHITPKQPLIFRNGKPFGTSDNALAETWPFPQPSTIAGAMRTAWAESQNKDYESKEDIATIKRKAIYGPLLTRYSEKEEPELLFSAPADSICLMSNEDNNNYIYKLTPEKISKNQGTDFIHEKLSPVFLNNAPKDKPAKNAPLFWNFNKMLNWLKDDNLNKISAEDQGIQSLPVELRTHVSINPESQTAESGHLFQTAGIDFGKQQIALGDTEKNYQKQGGWVDYEYGLACSFQEELPNTLRTIGAESRLGNIQKMDNLIPKCPQPLTAAINHIKAFRLILATPAIFEQGYLPKWINPETMEADCRGMKLRLHAVSVKRWQPGTSWDMASNESKQGKGMRKLQRLTPAGTVYWFEILSGGMDAEGFWLTSISDQREYDGYGLTLPGVWNIPEEMKSSNKDQ